ncbi:lectin-like domain-containing protein [Companilactobacillus baiquanensis]|uniref:Cell surface protein n=1 Tax=Companilactobacillus baiquanensis TaxID=2486005 RepID=A0ABW1UYJ6_9LACO|nr:hypothetical protein [Companilactobacillus baiquanensis]
MSDRVKLRYIWMVSTIILISLFFGKSNEIQAAVADNDPISSAPTGLNFGDYFLKGDVRTNNANTTTFKNGNTSIVQITSDYQKQQGYVWSNPSKMNYLNLNERQTLSMWVYLGASTSPGDGLAFVLQNYGNNANATLTGGNQAAGETMGVWGSDDTYKSGTSTDTVAAKAIQNSWALEFDTFKNDGVGGSSMFENGTPSDNNYKYFSNSYDDSLSQVASDASHIAYNYPAEPTTYAQKTTSISMGGFLGSNVQTYWYSMLHQGLKYKPDDGSSSNLKLSNGMWHHVVISYTPPADGSQIGHLSYTFDDKVKPVNDSLSVIRQPISEKNIPIDTSEFYKNSTQQFTQNDGKVLWGFTGSTGSSHARNMVVFESIPSLVEGDATATAYDDSQAGEEINSSNDEVYNGDNLRFVYNVKRESGELDWSGINAKIDLPDNMTYTGGNITYSDGSSEDISVNDLSSASFTKVLKDLLKSGEPKSATITVEGVANSDTPSVDKEVASTTASFEGTNLIKNVDSPSFTIKATTMKLTSDTTDLDLSSKSNIEADSTASYIDTNVSMDNSKVTAHYKINDNSEKMQSLSSGSDGKVAIKVSKTDLNDGNNTLIVYVTDSSGNRSNSITFNINKPTVAPILIDADSEMSFRTIHSNGKDQMVKRNGSWKVNVVDNEDNSNWKLSTSAIQDPDSNKFDGDLLYVDDNGSSQSILNGSIVQIADQSTFPSNFISDGNTYQVANTWDSDDGMILKADSGAKSGTYKYDVTWDLTDSI